jgi:hypothetical protein
MAKVSQLETGKANVTIAARGPSTGIHFCFGFGIAKLEEVPRNEFWDANTQRTRKQAKSPE